MMTSIFGCFLAPSFLEDACIHASKLYKRVNTYPSLTEASARLLWVTSTMHSDRGYLSHKQKEIQDQMSETTSTLHTYLLSLLW
ncbi:hypothetical protein Y032_0254g305 [Ancylostoma ceylanicum]|uniref:Uncharacterized protein n=1 Tax=Ancylostoma ceylanicum TaxID=53326 RepID=A0A016SBH6_9BILA|nr:hypothetical protein Y032_0254g305 [Ancylostoma ceylanicum]